ncbi:MAG TPA: efflux transporter outer membrane subunit [Opitutaceae bacterium]
MKSSLFLLASATTSAFAALPAIGPDYQRPSVESPAAYRDAELGTWKVAGAPELSLAPNWWTAFGDPALDALVERALEHNQDLRAAAARVEQARASAGLARAAFFPSLQVEADASRFRNLDQAYTTNDYVNVPATLSYELDLWGRVRRLNAGARAEAAAEANLFAAARLALVADVAQTYFALRATEREEEIVRATAATRQDARDVIAARLRGGTAAELDLARAETELATAEAELAATQQSRAALQNGLAVLVGVPASGFSLNDRATAATLPAVPADLPSTLLERRPDVAAAEQALIAANARIGVAKAAFFPAISLTGSAGYESAEFDDVFRWDKRVWSVGPRLYLPIFQGGRNRANLARSEAAYEEAVASFRQQVLVAFREVQDALTAARLLAAQAAAQERAAASARRAAQLSRTRYDAGYVAYLEVVDSERSALAAERASVRLGAQRLVAGVTLIKALGGGWHAPASGTALTQN